MLERGVWACCEYRFGHWVREEVRGPARPLLRILSKAWHLVIEMTTGISIDPRARIGAGLYIGHFGCIIVGGGVKMGENCNISQGVTIGVAGRDGRRGSPVIDHEVYIAPGAKVIGAISVGRGAAIGANAVVTKDLPANAVAVGVPATVVSLTGTRGLITNFA